KEYVHSPAHRPKRFCVCSSRNKEHIMANGQVLGVTKIVDAGPPEQRWNAVIVSEGYRSGEMAQFATDAKGFADALLAAAPLDRLRAAINIYRVDVTSTESGAKDPTGCN